MVWIEVALYQEYQEYHELLMRTTHIMIHDVVTWCCTLPTTREMKNLR